MVARRGVARGEVRGAKRAVNKLQGKAWIEIIIKTRPSAGAFLVFNIEVPEGRFYGFPIYGIPGFKIGKYHHLRERVDDLEGV